MVRTSDFPGRPLVAVPPGVTTLAIDNGASPKAIQAILGHSTLAMTMGIYAKATDRGKREAVNSLPFATATAPSHVFELKPKAVQMRTGERTSNSETDQPVAGRIASC